jgi:hypothetical protein
MVYARTIDAPPNGKDWTAIQYLCLSDDRRLTREQTYLLVVAGARITSGSERGPVLVRTQGGHSLRANGAERHAQR